MSFLSKAPLLVAGEVVGPSTATLLTALAVSLFANEDPCCPVHSLGHRGYIQILSTLDSSPLKPRLSLTDPSDFNRSS